MQTREFLCLLREVCRNLSGSLTLGELAKRAGQSRFHFHRTFSGRLGETPKELTQRLRLQRVAASLLTTQESVGEIAVSSGFSSHEVLTRAFRKHFGCTPSRYRIAAFPQASEDVIAHHLSFAAAITPCIRLFRVPLEPAHRKTDMTNLSITKVERPEQPILFIRRRILSTELQGMLAECFGKLYAHGRKAGLPIAGWPLARYISVGPGRWTVDAAMPVAAPVLGEGEMESGVLPGGPVVLGIHVGPYEQLHETNAAIEMWIEKNGLTASGPPWESYVTDPAEHPDPADWRTEVYWPIAK